MGDNKPIKVVPVVIEGFEVNGPNVTFQKLQEFSLTLFEKLLNHRKQRNFLLLERDKLRTILENTRYEIKLANNIGFNLDTEREKAENKYRQDLKDVDQEVKYIFYNHEINLTELKAWEDRMTMKSKDKQLEEELELLLEKRQLKEELEKERGRYNDEVSSLKEKHLDEITVLKQEIDALQNEKNTKFKTKFNKTVEQLNLKHEMEMSELEERKNTHIAELRKIHLERVEETKDFFNTITAENLTVISNLKQNLDSFKKSKTEFSTEVRLLRLENEKLREPLATSKAEVKTLTRKLINYEKDLQSLKNNKAKLENTLAQAKQVKKANQNALLKLNGFKSNSYNLPVLELNSTCFHSSTNLTSYIIEKRRCLEEFVYFLVESIKQKQNIIDELTSDSEIYQSLSKSNVEYWNPKQLSYELAIISKAHDELLSTLKEKLQEFCVPEQMLGFKVIKMPHTGANPAALVAKQ